MKRALSICLCMILFLSVPHTARAAENANTEKKAVVFLLDASGSMKTNDPKRYAIDSIAQLICSLPTDYETGFVAYNTEICADTGLVDNESREQIMEETYGITYEGYSNAGAGLSRAVELLRSSGADKRSIVMLSDGEFLMQDEGRTKQSGEAYRKAVDAAGREGIVIHVAGLGEEMENTENSIFQAAALTDGGIYYAPQALELPAVVESIVTARLGVRQMTAAIIDADGGTENVSIELPFPDADTVRLLLTSDEPIRNVKTNFRAESASQLTGERYSLIEVGRPKDSLLEISFAGTAGSQVRILLIPEYRVIPGVKVTYEDREPSEEGALRYDRVAVLEYTFYDAANENIRLWTGDYFEHEKIGIKTGEEKKEKALEKGTLSDRITVTENQVKEISFDCSALPVNVLSIENMELELEEAPPLPVTEPEPEPPYMLYGVIVAALAGILAVLVFRRPKERRISRANAVRDDRPAPGRASYVGKLNIYITRAPSGYDIAPLSYDLFRLPAAKVVTVAEILESCGIKEKFEGAERIYVSSGQGRSIILTNQSDCCIMKSGEILMRRKSYPLQENAKVDIAFEDEISELTFQYKVLKPSETA